MLKWVLVAVVQASDNGIGLQTQVFETKGACDAAKEVIVDYMQSVVKEVVNVGWSAECVADGMPPEHDFSNVEYGFKTYHDGDSVTP